ncbi:hypothetical protein XAP3CFBP6996_001415 [Xanthomonas citri pv. fuscans CFBP 6996]|uniref:Uncharacterized protein n=7 Tax=Xanthomonas TaxID=338 RepID=A0AB33CJV8_XANCI|nr:hypothetical protein XcvCFBP7111P_23500 [Xanthomonas citri pv. vignicola]PTY30755.1 hypothetical protein XAP3CFBP6996_001415 [Xanthomonas citri pv. fuscans CFBP 6996]QWN14691.1 hypothetical protein DGN02_01430 [Xanthomonas citri]ASK95137.1 hypothetical protein XcvCFBP7112P_01520 [Xanthomonas citri pv. vignicola]ASK99255.1 hypothetical protein XcvCFBP7113P_01425 [Xanthomonas citri pv. vignicola]
MTAFKRLAHLILTADGVNYVAQQHRSRTMLDPRIEKVDLALTEIAQDPSEKVALWQWACREMLHETLIGMHQLSHLAGIARQVANDWREPVDVIAPAKPYLAASALADRRLPQVLDGLGSTHDDNDRATLWRLRYASLIASTLQGMQALAEKHRIDRQAMAIGPLN